MKKSFPLVLALALILPLAATPAWSQSLAESWGKAKDATAEALGKTADEAAQALTKAADATAETLGKAKDSTVETWDKVTGKEKPKKPAAKPAFPATVLRATDGDTIVVRTNDAEDIKVRLYGIDAPEVKQEGGKEATAALRPLQGQMVIIREMDIDQSGQTVALVEHNGRSVNLDLVAQGHAWFYSQYCKTGPMCGQIKVAQDEARAAKRGLWAGEKPVAPWDWRKKK
jgi:endonuclease YncB( thermonuclease family)